MTAVPDVSVVLSTHDRPARLASLLASLAEQTLGRERLEVVVVDDASAQDTVALLERTLKAGELALTVISRSRSRGPAVARNEGWRAARAAVIAFTDDDCEATPEWLEQGLRACRAHPGAIVQGRTEPHPSELDRLGPFTRTMSVERAGPFYQTCNMFYPRDLLERLDGFDETFTAPGGEDTDLAWRALAEGTEAVFAEHALVRHAVEDLGPASHLRVAMRWADAMAMFRHPGLREEVLFHGVFWKESHALLVQALAGLAGARRVPAAAALALPYVRHLRHRCIDSGAPLALAPYFALHDLLETATAVRGALRHRVLVV